MVVPADRVASMPKLRIARHPRSVCRLPAALWPFGEFDAAVIESSRGSVTSDRPPGHQCLADGRADAAAAPASRPPPIDVGLTRGRASGALAEICAPPRLLPPPVSNRHRVPPPDGKRRSSHGSASIQRSSSYIIGRLICAYRRLSRGSGRCPGCTCLAPNAEPARVRADGGRCPVAQAQLEGWQAFPGSVGGPRLAPRCPCGCVPIENRKISGPANLNVEFAWGGQAAHGLGT